MTVKRSTLEQWLSALPPGCCIHCAARRALESGDLGPTPELQQALAVKVDEGLVIAATELIERDLGHFDDAPFAEVHARAIILIVLLQQAGHEGRRCRIWPADGKVSTRL